MLGAALRRGIGLEEGVVDEVAALAAPAVGAVGKLPQRPIHPVQHLRSSGQQVAVLLRVGDGGEDGVGAGAGDGVDGLLGRRGHLRRGGAVSLLRVGPLAGLGCADGSQGGLAVAGSVIERSVGGARLPGQVGGHCGRLSLLPLPLGRRSTSLGRPCQGSAEPVPPRSLNGVHTTTNQPPTAGHVDGVPAATSGRPPATTPLVELVGAGMAVPCLDGVDRPYRDLDCAASTPACVPVAEAVNELLPLYSSVHRGAGYKSRLASAAYDAARRQILDYAGRLDDQHVAVICRNTTESLNLLAFRLGLAPEDVVLTTVVEHHANLLPWARVARQRFVECSADGTFDVNAVVAGLDTKPRPAVLALTGASNVTGWLPPVEAICDAAHERGVPVVLDAAQLAPHRPVPTQPDYVAFSGHKLYAPFGSGALIGPRETFTSGEPFLLGGGAVELVDLRDVVWSPPPEREEAGSPNVVGAVALGAALAEMERLGWPAMRAHESALAVSLKEGLAALDGVRLLGPEPSRETLAVATFEVQGMHHALVAARLAAEWGIGVRHGCFCAHPYLMRLLGCINSAGVRARMLAGDRREIPGAVRASAGLGTTLEDVAALVTAVGELAAGAEAPVPYHQDPVSGDFFPETPVPGWWSGTEAAGGGCAVGS